MHDDAAGVAATPHAARLRHLAVRDFRNLAHIDLAPPAEGIVVIGENGQGKTNLLEAIYYLQLLRSARGARDQDVVRFGAEAFHIGATVETDTTHEIGIGFEKTSKRKRVRVDGVVRERLSDALGGLPSVMFSPADVELIAGAPAVRRRYLDIMLALTTRGYLAALQRYRTALAHRNAALRSAARSSHPSRDQGASVAVWEPALAEHGAVLWRARAEWTASIERSFEVLCSGIGERAQVRVRYSHSPALSADPVGTLTAALEEKRALDLKRGLTHAGPHRDDLTITLDGRDLRAFGSAGQQRTAAIALRMLEAATFTGRLGRAPVFLLDDPFAELDVRRAARILELLLHGGAIDAVNAVGATTVGARHAQQIVLAVPRPDDVPRELAGLACLTITAGQLSACA